MNPAELRTRRAALLLTQAQLAARLGVKRLAVARWETGARSIPALLPRALGDLERERRDEDGGPPERPDNAGLDAAGSEDGAAQA